MTRPTFIGSWRLKLGVSLVLGGCYLVLSAVAQSSAFTYQGRLDTDGTPAQGIYDLRFAIYDLASSGTPVAEPLTNSATAVSNGWFIVTLDFGVGVFTGAERWLELGVRSNNVGAFHLLTPRQSISAAPYAIRATQAATVDQGVVSNPLFFGTTTGAPLELFVNHQRALRLEDNGAGAPNLIGGSAANFIGAGAVGATIGGGGATNFGGSANPNTILAHYATIAGGLSNRIESAARAANILGGQNNLIDRGSVGSVISGGQQNHIGTNSGASVIGGGGGNQIEAETTLSVIGGGWGNRLGPAAQYSFIGGGWNNVVAGDGMGLTIAGGVWNDIGTNSSYSTIGGGRDSSIAADAQYVTIGGGELHEIDHNADHSTIGGGYRGQIMAGARLNTIAGGNFNLVWSNAFSSSVGGGAANNILAGAQYATIPGGYFNAATNYGFAAGRRARAYHPGAFVWADAADADFESTTDNQFNVRAGGGARFVTGGAGMTVDGAPVFAGTVPASGLSGTYTGAVVLANPANSFTGTGNGLTQVDAATLGGLASSQFWQLGGNAGTSPGVNFLGTTDNQPLEFKVNGVRALRLQDNGDGGDFGTTPDGAPNIIAGSPSNLVAFGVVGATISGGGATNYHQSLPAPNVVRADYGTVGGGLDNLVATGAVAAVIAGGYDNGISTNSRFAVLGGGEQNRIAIGSAHAVLAGGDRNEILSGAGASTISGGSENSIGDTAIWSTIGGGRQSQIQSGSFFSTVGGGLGNNVGADAAAGVIAGGAANSIQASASSSTIGGGSGNSIAEGADHATIPGGRNNRATHFGFAAGRHAKADHPGAFVWADSTHADFLSTATNQFNVRAGGGARFVTSGAGLSVDAPVRADSGSAAAPGLAFHGDPDTGLFGPAANQLAFATGGTERMRLAANGRLGLGTNTPAAHLHIASAGSTPQLQLGQHDSVNAFTRLRFSVGNANLWDVAAGGNSNVLNFFNSGNGNVMTLSTNGNLFIAGTLNPPSDRNVKQDFAPVDGLAVLEKVTALPIQSWAYKNSPETRHIGPVAQDFHAAFQFNGDDDKHISTVDADGVALAAIQGLNQKLEKRLQAQETEIAELKRALEKIQQLVNNLPSTQHQP